ncbi:hypothetical protein AVEN_198009-1 [Araneus ventricosus]|uniref:Uncharacterized protein n=1 Tax=Araneus ventricosus TaxID=182803 RepID=A0A4Y2QQ01_ARAVE|nr:hypothetical protein AVEN_198009-1 [Araneus ventricosus]
MSDFCRIIKMSGFTGHFEVKNLACSNRNRRIRKVGAIPPMPRRPSITAASTIDQNKNPALIVVFQPRLEDPSHIWILLWFGLAVAFRVSVRDFACSRMMS